MTQTADPFERALATIRGWNEQKLESRFNGKIVMVKEGEMVIDKISGTSYIAEKTWEAMNKAFPRVPRSTPPDSAA